MSTTAATPTSTLKASLTLVPDIEKSPKCSCFSCPDNEVEKKCKEILSEDNSYKAMHDYALSNRCKELRDHFHSSASCSLADKITKIAERILSERSDVFLDGSATVFMSALLRRETTFEKDQDDSDLTGDGGKLAFRSLVNLEKKGKIDLGSFETIVDIGGQDTNFVKNFECAKKRIVLDQNLLTPFLSNGEGTILAIGDADKLLETKEFTDELIGKKLFAMSNFINVLNPKHAWNILEKIMTIMKKDDELVITNLFSSYLEKKDKFEKGMIFKGIQQYLSKIDKKPYKSTITPEFVELIRKEGDFELISNEINSTHCRFTSAGTRSEMDLEIPYNTIVLRKK